MTETMKAMVLTAPGEAEYRDVPMPVCEPGGILLKMDAVGLCGSDVRTFKHGHAKVAYPAIIGHENAGTIVEIDPQAQGDWQVGQRVVVNPGISCGQCYYCRHDDTTGLCTTLSVYGNDIPGGMAEYMPIPTVGVQKGQMLAYPPEIPAEEIILAESLSSVYRAQKQLNVSVGETVVIIGAGPIGCLHTQLARIRGAVNIVLADINQARLDQSSRFGATHAVNNGVEDLNAVVMELTQGLGADVAVAAVPTAAVHQSALELLRKGGRLSYFGGVPKDNPWSKVDANLIHYNRLALIGAYSYSMADFQDSYNLVVANKVDRQSLITHKIPLSRMKEGLDLIASGEAIKVAMTPDKEN